jgi:hypothetical protein
MNERDRELEQILRSLPIPGPPPDARERILRAASAVPNRRRGVTWKQGLAYALCLLALVALDIGVGRAQSARLSRLVGDGQLMPASPQGGRAMIAALRERKALVSSLVDRRSL